MKVPASQKEAPYPQTSLMELSTVSREDGSEIDEDVKLKCAIHAGRKEMLPTDRGASC